MAALRVVNAIGIILLVTLTFCAAGRPTTEAFDASAKLAGDSVCQARDIDIRQDETSGVGIPTFTVQITNSCTNPRCTISNVIVNCGQFHSPNLVNPNKFKRYGPGTCIVNNGGVVPNAGIVTFEYREIWRQNLSLQSAKVTCV